MSSTEKFDTSTPMGRAMLNICIVFAQLERETIQKRVQDAWYSRCQRGFKMGGKTPYGFRTEPYVMDGVRTKKLVIEPTEAAFVRQMYEMYADPQVSLHDITKKLTVDGMRTYHGRPLSRATLSVILRNPIYVMADLDIYEFYKSQGTDIYNDAADFAGTNGCYYYQGKGNTEDKHKHLQGQTLVLAPHEGFIPSELWLKCRKKLLASHTYQPARKARNTWMAGKIKCGKCGYALMSAHSNGILYLRCTVHADSKACPGCGCVKLHELEAVVYGAMVKKLKDFKTLTGRNKAAKISPKLTAKRLELAQVESEIEKLLDTLTGASPVLLSYANSKIEELDARRQSIANEIAKLITYLKDDSDKDIKSSSWRKLRFLDKFVIFDKDIYITASKIIFAKREYSRFIVEMYFTLLFDEHWYTPKEVLEIYNDNLKLLRDIYFFMLCNDNMVDLKGTFLLYFLHIEKEWIDDFANHVADNINSERDHDNYRYMALWRADEYLEYYDCIFKKLANSETYISEWRLTNLFKSILFYGNKDELIKNRQEAWIMHIIEENAMSDSVIIIFEALSEADIVLRKKALLLFLSINDDYELFKKIPLDPSHWEGNAGEIVFQLTKRIDFLESLISELKGVKYLRHVKRIRDRIEMWKSTIKEEELRAICRKLYQ